MFDIGMPELIVILIIVFIIFGAKRIPEIGKGLGGLLREVKNIKKEINSSPSETNDSGEKKNVPDLLEEKVKQKVIDQVPGVKKAKDISDKVKKVQEVLK